MRWDLAEMIEDSLVAYLKPLVNSDMRVAAAWELDDPQYPMAVVFAASSEPASDEAEWHDSRVFAVMVSVITEGVHELSSSGSTLTTARERNALARSSVMNALFVSDLKTQLIAEKIEALAISMAQFATTERVTDGRYLVTEIEGLVIAEPVTGS